MAAIQSRKNRGSRSATPKSSKVKRVAAKKSAAKKPAAKSSATKKSVAKTSASSGKGAKRSIASSRTTINMRVPSGTLTRIDRAAELSASSRSLFMVQAAEIAASHILLDQALFRLDTASYEAFAAALDAPAKPPATLVELLRAPAPWEREGRER